MTANINFKGQAQAYYNFMTNDYVKEVRKNPFIGFNQWNDHSDLTPRQKTVEKAQLIFAAMVSVFATYVVLTTTPVAALVVLTSAVVVHSLLLFSETKAFSSLVNEQPTKSSSATASSTSSNKDDSFRMSDRKVSMMGESQEPSFTNVDSDDE